MVLFCQLIAHNLSILYCKQNKTIHSFILSSLIKSFIATNDIQLGLVLKALIQNLPGFDK